MRLLFLSPSATLGGAERVLLDLLGLVRRARPSWTLLLLASHEGPLLDEAKRLGVRTKVLPLPRSFARLGDSGLDGPLSWGRFAGHALVGGPQMALYMRRLRREIEAFAPDVVHSNGFKMHVLGALAKPERASLVWHVHDYPGARRVTGKLLTRLKGKCNAVIAVSESVAADVRTLLGDGVPVRAVLNSVDASRFTPEGPRLDLDAKAGMRPASPGVIRVGLLATFARWKGHTLFLDAVKALHERYNIRAYIIGGPLYQTDGSQYTVEELRGIVNRMHLGHVVGLTGFVNDPATALRGLDIVVHGSTAPEPFGLVVAEAMATARAVVASQGGGVSELVENDVDALTYPQGDVAMLTQQLEWLVTDPALRRRLAQAGRRSAIERFDPKKFCDQILEIYERFDRAAAA